MRYIRYSSYVDGDWTTFPIFPIEGAKMKRKEKKIVELEREIDHLRGEISFHQNLSARYLSLSRRDNTLDRVKDNEPIFVFRAQDIMAPMFIRLWADKVKANQNHKDKYERAYRRATEMDVWGETNTRKFPD